MTLTEPKSLLPRSSSPLLSLFKALLSAPVLRAAGARSAQLSPSATERTGAGSFLTPFCWIYLHFAKMRLILVVAVAALLTGRWKSGGFFFIFLFFCGLLQVSERSSGPWTAHRRLLNTFNPRAIPRLTHFNLNPVCLMQKISRFQLEIQGREKMWYKFPFFSCNFDKQV